MRKKIQILFLMFCPFIGNTQIIENNIVLHLNFDNEATDLSTTELDLEISGAENSDDRFGNENSSYIFDGVNDNISSEPDAYPCFIDQISISTWIKFLEIPSTQENPIYLTKNSYFIPGNTTNVGLRFDNGLSMSYYNQSSGALARDTSDLALDGEWHHIVGSIRQIDGEVELKLFIDNQLVNGRTIIPSDVGVNELSFEELNHFYIGGGFGNNFSKCQIDDLRIYNRAITDCEIGTLFTEFQNTMNCGETEDTACDEAVFVSNAIKDKEYNIYPNPTTGLVNLKNVTENFDWELYNSTGLLLDSGLSLNNQLDFREEVNGLYFLKVNKRVFKLFKIH